MKLTPREQMWVYTTRNFDGGGINKNHFDNSQPWKPDEQTVAQFSSEIRSHSYDGSVMTVSHGSWRPLKSSASWWPIRQSVYQ